jgi:hypothetical protein
MGRKLRLIATGVAGIVAFALAVPAYGIGTNPDPGPPSSAPPPPVSTPGSSGAPAHQTVRNCSLFATSATFGLSCIHGGGDVRAKTVKQVLGKDSAEFCWDEVIPDDQLRSQYGYEPNPDSPYYLHSCISGLIADNLVSDQPGMQLGQHVVEIDKDAKDCPGKQPYPVTDEGVCIMHLTENQHALVSQVDPSDPGRIPDISIATHPSTRVRTNEDVAYTDNPDVALSPGDDGLLATPKITLGGVTMWAEMDGCGGAAQAQRAKTGVGECFSIRPYGPGSDPQIFCKGDTDVSDHDTPQTKPDACWWKYPRSSAAQPNQAYPFLAEADWTVYFQAGGAPVRLQSFKKYDYLQLPVFDIQSIVIP